MGFSLVKLLMTQPAEQDVTFSTKAINCWNGLSEDVVTARSLNEQFFDY